VSEAKGGENVATPEDVPRVEYALTPLGRTLVEPLTALCRWAAAHLEEVEAARARFAERPPP
jgi:DNA-binding HxlR family transcriptional regulator